MQGGVQKISLQDDENGSCMVHHTIVHELLHCIGLWHEQSRYDRDDYITIRWENIANSEPPNTMKFQSCPYLAKFQHPMSAINSGR